MDKHGSLVLHNAEILTMEKDRPAAAALAIVEGRIRALGSYQDVVAWIDSAELVIDGQGATVLPGFIDTHVHFTLTGLGKHAVDLNDARSVSDALRHIEQAVDAHGAGDLIVAMNYQPELVPGHKFPTADELDKIAGRRPVYVMESGGHWSAVSNAALALLNLDPNTPGVGRSEAGRLTGLLSGAANTAAFTILWQRYAEQIGLKRAFDAAAADAVAGGITTLHALDDLDHVKELLAYEDKLPLRIVPYCQTQDVAAVKALGLRQIGGCGQVMVDGDFGPHTAALLDPYLDEPGTRGTLYYEDKALAEFVHSAHAAGLQVALHCIGSGAIEQLLNAYEHSLETAPRRDHRHRIEHFQLPAPGQAARARRLGVALATQPAFNHFWPHDTGYPEALGWPRALQMDPLRSLLEEQLPVAFGSDSPVTPLRPLLWVHSAVNHSNQTERIPVDQALHSATAAGSWVAFEEKEKGTLDVGKLGDLVVLSANPLNAPPDEIKDIQVLKTIVGGRVVYESS